jgi:NAD(P)-dependent dehydrogenase (short-subunit alcohol dehydrogenase family)
MLLKDKIVIVSGIGPGLGVKLAVEAARAGASGVVLAARGAAKLDDAEQRIRELGTGCNVLKVPTDIGQRAQCRALAAATVERFGRIDALVNSAYSAGNVTESIESSDLDGWRAVFDTNLFGTMNLTQEVVPHMKAHGGAIAMINSMVTRQALPGQAAYAASKGALATTVKYLAKELGQYGIRVNSVLMGWMWGAPVQGFIPHMAAAQGISEEDVVAQVAARIPLGRIPTDDECAQAALFMVSDYARAVTGASLDVNGGEFMP